MKLKAFLKKPLALLAALCLLVGLVSVAAVSSVADEETYTIEKLTFEYLGRLPNNDPKNIIQVSVSQDGENFTEATRLTGFDDGAGGPMWVGGQYSGEIDITAATAGFTGPDLYVRLNLSAGVEDWCSMEQVRLAGKANGKDFELWEHYDEMAAGSQNHTANAVDSANVKLSTMDYGQGSFTTLQPAYSGQLDMCYITYKIDLDGKKDEVSAKEKLTFEVLGRLPADENDANRIEVLVSADGSTWKQAALINKDILAVANNGNGHREDTYVSVDITDAADLTADTLYVKVNLLAYLAEWMSIRQLRITKGDETLIHAIYDDMTNGSEEYKTAEVVDSANLQLRGTYATDAAANPNGLTMTEDHDGQDNAAMGDNYITYKFNLGGESGGEQLPEESFTVDKLTFEYLGRLPENGEGKNKVIVSLSTDGENWEEVYIQNPFQANGQPAWGGGQYSDVVDLATLAADFIGKEIPALYVRFGLNAGIVDWCSVEQMRIMGAVDGGAEQELLYEKFDEMSVGSEDYRTAKYIDSRLVRLANFDGKTTLQPATGHDAEAENQCYIVYKLLGTVNPNEVTPGQGGSEGDEGGSGGSGGAPSEGVLLGNAVSLGYKVDFNKMEDASTDWQNDAYEVSAMKVFYDSGDKYTMLCPDASQNVNGIGYATYKIVAEEGQNLGMMGVSMVGRIFNYPDSSEGRYLTVEYSLDDGATWQTAKHYISGTNGLKTQNYRAILGNIDQNAVLVRILMSSGMNDWVGLQSLEFMTPASVKPGFFEDFGAMRPNSSNYQANAFNFNTTRIFADTESGYTSLTTDMNVTAEGKSFIEYLVMAEDGQTLDNLKLVMTGRVFDFNNDANRGVAISVSENFGATYIDIDRIAAGENSNYEQYYEIDLSEAAAGKTELLVRLDINSAHWDWVGVETIELTTDDVSDGGDDNTGDDNTGDDNTGDDNTGDDNTGDDNTGDDDSSDKTDSPETGSTLPYVAFAVVLMAGLCVAILRKKQIN